MYLPTFWKLSSEVYMYKMAKVAGWGLPAACMGKSTYHCARPIHQNHQLARSPSYSRILCCDMAKSYRGHDYNFSATQTRSCISNG